MATSIIKSNADYIVEQGTSGNWKYRKWKSGRVEAWGYKDFSSIPVTNASATYGGYRSAVLEIAIPSGIFDGTPQAFITKVNSQGAAIYYAEPKSATLIQFLLGGSSQSTTLSNQRFNVYCVYGG